MNDFDSYHENGFLIKRGLLSAAECKQILAEGMKLIEGDDVPNRIMQPHQTTPCFKDCLVDPRLVGPLEAMAEEEITGVQTMFYIKPPGSTGHGWHQDNFYITGQPKPVMAAWCALGRITGENGGLTVFPGSHKTHEHLPMVKHDFPYFKNHDKCVLPPDEYESQLVEMEAGDVLFFDGYLIHGSYPNKSTHDERPAFIAHYLPTASILPSSTGDRVPVR